MGVFRPTKLSRDFNQRSIYLSNSSEKRQISLFVNGKDRRGLPIALGSGAENPLPISVA
jgi:hypothetical protein